MEILPESKTVLYSTEDLIKILKEIVVEEKGTIVGLVLKIFTLQKIENSRDYLQ